MKRSDFFIRLTTGVIFLAVAFYVGVSLYNAIVNTFVTTSAMNYTIEETLTTRGYIVRTETVAQDYGVSVLPTAGEGERVAAGQAIAVEYMSPAALEAASELHSLRMMLSQLESTRSDDYSSSFDAIRELSSAVNTHDFSNLAEISMSVETSIFAADTDISALQHQIANLEGRDDGTRTIVAQMAGTFSHVVDGFEHIVPSTVYQMGPRELVASFSTPQQTHGFGKLVTEHRWYFAAIVDSSEASQLSQGDTKPVRFSGAFNEEVNMTIENISNSEDNLVVVLFSSDRGIHNVTPMRSLHAEIVMNVVSGIRVPKDAIHLDDDLNTFVYLQTAGFAERVAVEILDPPGIVGDSYLVRDGIETGSPLRVDSIIIVRANDLYHGRVIG
ncbi:MAG: hypothetical protein FWD05_04875 [Oscillospiraceae bacterium]|nr:hypothetical protein [Oscillospiraceae bacterium]